MRSLTSGQLTALSSSILYPAIFVQMGFRSETVYLWTGNGSVSWNSQTWLGAGGLLNITTMEDSSTVEAKGITITLSGLDSTLFPEVMTDFQLGLPVTVYLALYDGSGSLIDTPITSWSGNTDQPTVEFTGQEFTLAVNCESELISMNVPVDRRYTLEDAQIDNPGDNGFMFVDGLQEKTLYWMGAPNSTNNI